jgi:hypothetical protein
MTVAAVLMLATMSSPASAHLATWGSWEVTKKNLDVLFPNATKYLRKNYVYSSAEVAALEKSLGFDLYPEDRTPQFYIAVKETGGVRTLLGVALFVDPRVKPKVVGGVTQRLEVGIGVDNKGRVTAVAVYDYRGDRALTKPKFLNQLIGRALSDAFKVGPDAIRPVKGEEEESQLVANAAREALLLMKTALGKRP